MDSGYVTVNIVYSGGTPQAPDLDVALVNPGTSLRRDLCLNVATGSSAAYECSDLRIVHPLPGIRTISKKCAPALIYNSQHAHPYPLVGINVSLPGTAAIPDSVNGTLKINNVARRGAAGPAAASFQGRLEERGTLSAAEVTPAVAAALPALALPLRKEKDGRSAGRARPTAWGRSGASSPGS